MLQRRLLAGQWRLWPRGVYSYACPEPEGFGQEPSRLAGAAYNGDVGQFLIDYDAANKGGWERKGLER